MKNIINDNTEIKPWIRPWMKNDFSDLSDRDERFFGILMKGLLNWLNNNIILYNKPIQHFIFNTGSSYLYIESNGYEFSWSETSGEDTMYMKMPRCIVEFGDINIPQEELSNPFVNGVYERKNGNNIEGFNAQIKRLPINQTVHLRYVLSNFNESIILLEELLDKIIFQQYFKIVYLGQVIQCSIEYPNATHIEINKIDMSDPNSMNQKTIDLDLNICTSYPIINERTEKSNKDVINSSNYVMNINKEKTIDTEKINV